MSNSDHEEMEPNAGQGQSGLPDMDDQQRELAAARERAHRLLAEYDRLAQEVAQFDAAVLETREALRAANQDEKAAIRQALVEKQNLRDRTRAAFRRIEEALESMTLPES